MIAVYLYGDRAFIASEIGHRALKWVVEPVSTVPIAKEAVSSALRETIEAAPFEGEAIDWSGLRKTSNPIFKASGARSQGTFQKKALPFHIYIDESGVDIESWVPDVEYGFVRDEHWSERLPASATAEEIADIILGHVSGR